MARVRVGLIGFGKMGRRHARSLTDLAEVDFVGVADRAESAGRQDTAQLPIVPDVERLLELGPEAVVIATPPTTQRGWRFAWPTPKFTHSSRSH